MLPKLQMTVPLGELSRAQRCVPKNQIATMALLHIEADWHLLCQPQVKLGNSAAVGLRPMDCRGHSERR